MKEHGEAFEDHGSWALSEDMLLWIEVSRYWPRTDLAIKPILSFLKSFGTFADYLYRAFPGVSSNGFPRDHAGHCGQGDAYFACVILYHFGLTTTVPTTCSADWAHPSARDP